MKKTRLADEQLVNSFQATNSADSFEALYSRYVNKVYHKCLSITKDSDAAQDYTQDIFIKVFNKLDSFQNQSAFSTWLYTIAHNYCLDQLRISKRLTTEVLSDEQAGSLPEPNSSSALEECVQGLESVLNLLPQEEIDLLRLKHEQGLSVRAISQRYQISESAVKMRLKRAREKVQKLYAKRLSE